MAQIRRGYCQLPGPLTPATFDFHASPWRVLTGSMMILPSGPLDLRMETHGIWELEMHGGLLLQVYTRAPEEK